MIDTLSIYDRGPAKANRYAVLICARNEQRVIGDLIASLRGQTYDQSLLSIFVLADNCTDDTAMVARVAGAHVYERRRSWCPGASGSCLSTGTPG